MKNLSVLKINEVNAIKKLKEILSAKFNVMDLKIFGSKVRGEGKADSDIDIMIKIDKSEHGIISKIYDIVFEINLENDSFISPVIFNRVELEEGPLSESPLYKRIEKEGVKI